MEADNPAAMGWRSGWESEIRSRTVGSQFREPVEVHGGVGRCEYHPDVLGETMKKVFAKKGAVSSLSH